MQVFEMAASLNGEYFLAAEFKNKIQVWSASNNKKLAEFSTHFAAGDKRMAISNDGSLLAAAAYARFGITLYDTNSVKEIWTNKQIKRIQQIAFSEDDSVLYVINSDNILYALAVSDGNILFSEQDRENITVSRFGTIVETAGKKIIYNKRLLSNMPYIKLVLGMCAFPQGFCFSNMGGGLFCYNPKGRLMWKADNKKAEHYVKLAYFEKYQYLLALAYKYDIPRTQPYYFVDVYDVLSGNLKYKLMLEEDASEYVFISNSEKIISNRGTIYCFGEHEGVLCEEKIDIHEI